MREICIAGMWFGSYSSAFKNSILRRAPYRKSYILMCHGTNYYYRYIDTIGVHRYFPITQLKICKVS